MKKYIFSAFAFAALLVSCAKEDSPAQNIDTPANVVEIRGIINNDDVKTSYDISGSTAYFHWTGTETIGRLWYKSTPTPSFGHDAFTSTTSADSNETALVFSGSESANQTDYCMYPIWNNTTKTGIGWRSSPFDLYLHDTMAYNSADPLKDLVPMIAKIDGSGDFVFVPVTGIIAVTVTNLPSTANKITLSSTGKALSGYYRLTSTPANYASNIESVMTNGLTTGIAANAGNTTGTKTLTFSGLDRGEHVFYFPVSVGTYDDMTITVYADETPLQTVTTTKSIPVAKGEIKRFPVMDLAKATKVQITGDANAAYFHVDTFGPEATSVKFAVATTSDAALTGVDSGTAITAAGEANKQSIFAGISDTGTYYLAYKVFDSSSSVLLSDVKKIYFINDTDKNKYLGNYTFTHLQAFTINNNSSWVDLTSKSNTMTFELSDDPTRGFLMLTDFIGFNYTGTMTNTSLCGAGALITPTNSTINFDGTYTAGYPQYGYFNDSGWLVFSIDFEKPFFSLDGETYYTTHGQSQYTEWGFTKADNGSKITLTGTSGANTLSIVKGSKLKDPSIPSYTYATADIMAKFGNGSPVAYREY